MKVLGVHDGHSASACIIDDDQVVAAIQEERLTREKNRGGAPKAAVQRILELTGTSLHEIDQVAFSTLEFRNPGLHTTADVMTVFGRTFTAPAEQLALESRGGAVEQQRRRAEFLRDAGYPEERIQFIDHHTCHAATAYFARGTFDQEVLVLTSDGHGDDLCASVSVGSNGKLTRLAAVPRDDSIAAIYGYVTYLLGFVPLEHEYKLMGMAPYAENTKAASEICALFESMFEMDPAEPLIWKRRQGTPPVTEMAPMLLDLLRFRRFDTVMAGLQMFAERVTTQWVTNVVRSLGITDLAFGGGLFMNVKINQRIAALPEVTSAFFCPSGGDESNSLGAAWVAADTAPSPTDSGRRPLPGLYLGSEYTDADVAAAVDQHTFLKSVRVHEVDDIEDRCAALLADKKIVARFAGRMEFGARALGNRSILANPSDPDATLIINQMVKKRDFWMPFAPTVLRERAHDYLTDWREFGGEYMAQAFSLNEEKFHELRAAVHPQDHTCRPQILSAEANPRYHRLIKLFEERTGIGAVLNTSFNLHGYPIVESPAQALRVFDLSGLRYLALGNLLIEQDDAPAS
ncbi:carbamoyltransferase C-terminal domain-containing protein [Nonomuraea angiospora]|uniref:Carbamoyltransferase n=1 Tax=Nonomuraea angiospora TaxID=46172 RepID=A0ABR9LQ95_9ACTN|nr:carbamoyltransferase C-terminal domain-containing protein [Nonomuraea angiospora]MBE1582266.1 carbamoyltransferase [Nonomuraea angiospora]